MSKIETLRRELDRCDREIAAKLAEVMERVHPQEALLGFYDWNQERRIVLEELEELDNENS